MVMGGNSLLVDSERPIAAPSRTRAAASATASRIGRFVTTSPAIRKASSTGTEDPERMLKVRVKRAVLKPRESLPMSGIRSIERCHLRRAAGLRSQRLKRTTATTTAMIRYKPFERAKSLVEISSWVIHGNLALLASNTATTLGTTKVIRPATIAKHMQLSTIG